MICLANQLTGFYMMATLAFNKLGEGIFCFLNSGRTIDFLLYQKLLEMEYMQKKNPLPFKKIEITKTCDNFSLTLSYSRKRGHACGIRKKGLESSVQWHNQEFFPLHFLN